MPGGRRSRSLYFTTRLNSNYPGLPTGRCKSTWAGNKQGWLQPINCLSERAGRAKMELIQTYWSGLSSQSNIFTSIIARRRPLLLLIGKLVRWITQMSAWVSKLRWYIKWFHGAVIIDWNHRSEITISFIYGKISATERDRTRIRLSKTVPPALTAEPTAWGDHSTGQWSMWERKKWRVLLRDPFSRIRQRTFSKWSQSTRIQFATRKKLQHFIVSGLN